MVEWDYLSGSAHRYRINSMIWLGSRLLLPLIVFTVIAGLAWQYPGKLLALLVAVLVLPAGVCLVLFLAVLADLPAIGVSLWRTRIRDRATRG
jgi:hypothetical protein